MLQHQVLLFCLGETFSEQPPIHSPMDLHVNSRANAANFDGSVPKPGLEMNWGAGLVGTLYSYCVGSSKVLLVPLQIYWEIKLFHMLFLQLMLFLVEYRLKGGKKPFQLFSHI
jgi:hypothetical protein